MGWAGGSSVMDAFIVALNKANVGDPSRLEIYKQIIPAMEDMDWDTQDECEGADPAFDMAMRDLHPEWYDDEYEEEDED